MSDFMSSPKKASSPLAYHRVLSPSASIKLSPIYLGTMNFGEAFKAHLGECTKETMFKILDHFHAAGGNFIGTANMYNAGQSEQYLGEWMTSRKVRNQMIVATKYTNPLRFLASEPEGCVLSNYAGSNKKSLKLSLDQSLENLQTDYVDILYVHAWDIPSEELMRALDDVVRKGKDLYLGVSNWPAWAVVKANAYACQHGLNQFVVYQGRWNPANHDIEREIVPMCKSEDHDGRGISDILGGAPYENFQKIGKVMDDIGKPKGFDAIAVALRYVMLKEPYVFPIIGGRKVQNLDSNIRALKLDLTMEEIDKVEAVNPFEYGFPYAVMSGDKYKTTSSTDLGFLFAMAGYFDGVEEIQAIRTTHWIQLSQVLGHSGAAYHLRLLVCFRTKMNA